jgi:hypothetical protein
MKKTLLFIVIATLAITLIQPVASHAAQKQRNYMLVFDALDFTNQVKDTINFFFNKILQKGDLLVVFTPARVKVYSAAKLNAPKRKLASDLIKLLKNDIMNGSKKKRILLKEMENLAVTVGNEGAGPGGTNLRQYMQLRQELLNLRGSFKDKLIQYAQIFRRAGKGDNSLIMIMEREQRPIPGRDQMTALRSGSRSTAFLAVEAFEGEKFKTGFDLEELKAQFKYANIRFHLMYYQGKQRRQRSNIQWVDNLGDAYTDISTLVKTTDGLKMTTSKASKFLNLVRQITVEGKVSTEVIDQQGDE